MEYIPMFAKGTTKGTDFQAVLDSNQHTLKALQDTRSSHQANLQQLDTAELQCQQAIQDNRDLLVKMIDEKAKHDQKMVRDKFKAERETVTQNITAANEQIDAAETIIKCLNEAKGDNESELFVYIKQGETTQQDGVQLLHTLQQYQQKIPKHQVHSSIEKLLGKVKGLGDFVDEPGNQKSVKVKLRSVHKVKTSAEKSTCSIQGVCSLPDGSFIITDHNNKSLKQLDKSYKVTRQLDMSTEPCDVCHTNTSNQVAVTLPIQKTVQFVCIGTSLKKTHSFSVGDYCKGIACSRGELFVACGSNKNPTGGNVRLFSLSGTALRTIEQGPAGQNLFSVLNFITISSCGNFLQITDINKGIITIDRKGNLLATFSDPDLDHATYICRLDNDDLLVCGIKSHNILHVTRDGRKLGVVLRQQDGIVKPMVLFYDSVNSWLIVTTHGSDTIKVYDVHTI